MVRDLRLLADTTFDVLVVGAGIYGAAAAWDAAQRGLSVAVIDRGDFGSGTSFNNLKTVHGGLRSLQSLNFRQMRLFIRERRALARLVPHLVRPLPFIVPTYRDPRRSSLLMRLALAINDAVSRDRHEGIADPSRHLPPGAIVSREECLQLSPAVDPGGVTGGAVWYDYQMHNTDRVTLAFLLSATDAGAVGANYLEATGFLTDAGRVTGVAAVDRLGGGTLDIRARVVLNAAGPWAGALLASLPDGGPPTPAPRLSLAMNLVTRPVARTHACGGIADGRFLFLVPWRDVSILGTSHEAHDGGPDALEVTRWDLEALLADARKAFPHANLTAADVRLIHRGLLPMVSGHEHHVRLLRESAVIDHRRTKLAGLVSMFGVRYTTARKTAADAVDAVFAQLGAATPPPCRTAELPLVGGAIGHYGNFERAVLLRAVPGMPAEALGRLAGSYGTAYDAVLQIVRDRPELAAPLGRRCQVTGAEILHAARGEMAMKLGDAVLRRTEAGSAGHPGTDALEAAAAIMAPERGWDEWQARNEVAEVEGWYQRMASPQ
ncbi:MAG: FAD-dependent oxidoreductase [Vicinamibacterales bacterium]|nr:FAD-dependent oxidoreductase [Vicinamibacterales bacterium]